MKKNLKPLFIVGCILMAVLSGFSLLAVSSDSRQISTNPADTKHFLELEVPIAGHISPLKVSSIGGDIKATCRLGFELDRCSLSTALDRSATYFEKRAAAMDTDDPSKSRRANFANTIRKQADQAKRVCVGVSKKDADDGWRYTLLAAKKGHQQAAIRYVMQVGAGLNLAELTDSNDAWLSYKENAPILFSDALTGGSAQAQAYVYAAFNHLSERPGWRILPFDPIKGVAYYETLKIYASSPYKEVLDRNIEYSIKTKNMSASDLEQVSKYSRELAAKLVNIPIGGIDFVYGVAPSENAAYCNL